jgi:hypothetical protein
VVLEGAKGGQAATTNQAGQFTMAGLTPGTYSVKVSAPGFDDFTVQVTLNSDADQEVDAVLTAKPVQAEPVATPSSSEPPASAAPMTQEPVAAQPKATGTSTVTAQELNVKVQRGRAAVYGNVTDPTGALVPAGTAAVQGATGAPQTASVNDHGQYVLNGLIPGQYKLTISSPGFAPFQTDITLATNQGIEIDAPLAPPSEKTTVNVEASNAAQIQTETAHIEGTITEKEVLKTGLNGRNFTQLIALAPGVSNQTGQDEALVGVKGSVKYSVNGGRVEYNNFDVDGSDVLNAGLNGAESTLMVYPSLDAIQEVKVLTSNYGAMYGRSASGTVLVTTKSGTPKFHGGLYDFLRNEFFNSRNYFDQTRKAPLYRRQDFGGTIGGPLHVPGSTAKDKAFFFWSEEFRLEKTPQEFNQAVPTLAERGIGVNCLANSFYGQSGPGTCGDFSDVCPFVGSSGGSFDRRLYPDCPASGNAGSGQLNSFTANQVPMNPFAANLLATGMIPLPNSPTGCNSSLAGTINPTTSQPNIPCYDAVISPSTYWREELGRFDYDFTQSTRLSFRYIHDAWNTTVLTPQWGYVVNSFPSVENKFIGPGISMVVRLTNTLSPSLLNEFTASYVNSHITLADINGPGANLQPLPACSASSTTGCLGYIFNNNFGGKPPGIVVSGTNAEYGGLGFTVDPSYPPWEHTNPTYGISDNVSKSLGGGKHTLQVGIQVIDAQRNETNGAIGAATGDLQGLLTYSNQSNFYTSGNAFADVLGSGGLIPQGNPIKSYQQDSAQLKYYNDYWITEPYVQDDWHVNRRLTLNMGVRFSLFGNFHEKNENAWNWVASAYSSQLASTVQLAPPPSPQGASGLSVSGYFEYKNGQTFPFDPNNPQNTLFPYAGNPVTNGLVQCGKNGVPSSCMTTHLFNPAPRIGFAFDPKGDGRTSIRGGYGIFYEHGTAKEANTGSLEGSSPLVLSMTQPFPFYYSNVGKDANGNQGVAFPLDVTSIPTKGTWPYVQQWSFSIQRQLPRDTVASVAYVGSKGTHLSAELQENQLSPPPTGAEGGILPTGNPYNPGQPIVSTDCNGGSGYFLINNIPVTANNPAFINLEAACYGSLNPANGSINDFPYPNTLRPYFGFQRILSLQNVADSQYHALQATMRRTRGPLTLGLSYTYSHSFDDSSDRSDASFVNSANIRSSWASSNFDQRHLFNFNYIYDVPKLASAFERMATYRKQEGTDSKPVPPSGLMHALLDGWQISGITVFQSGTPFSVINGGSNIGISVLDNAGVANGAGAGSYPDIVSSPKSVLPTGITRLSSQSIGPLLYNPAAFAPPQGLTFGNAGRNFLDNPHRINFDMSLLKNFKVTEGSNMEFRFEAFNVFNHTQFRIFNPNIGNAANNTISCYGGGIGAPYTAAGGLTYLPGNLNGQPQPIDCVDGSSFLRPIDAHRPRTIQLGLKYSF